MKQSLYNHCTVIDPAGSPCDALSQLAERTTTKTKYPVPLDPAMQKHASNVA
jgi:hypothetical protein